MTTIGKLENHPIRDVWEKENENFTPWLSDNIGYLSEKLDLNLSVIEKEKDVGPFHADILAEDPNYGLVIIENQFEKSNHDHLGKILTYLTNLNAKIGIWICEDPRPEHIKSIEWLNEVTPKDISFYLVKIEVVKINESPPAPLFTVLSSPSESKVIGNEIEKLADRHIKRLNFWEQLLEKCEEKIDLFKGRRPTKDNWISASSGISGIVYSFIINKGDSRIELYIDKGKNRKNENKALFDKLKNDKQDIELKLGFSLTWQRLDDRRASRIFYKTSDFGWNDENKWEEIQNKMINRMIKLIEILNAYLIKYNT